MKTTYPEHWPQFFTATIKGWKPLLKENKHKDVIIDSLKFLVEDKRIYLFAFVIMSNHLHSIWQPLYGHSPSSVQAAFLKFTGFQFKNSLLETDPVSLALYEAKKNDRSHHFWKRESLSVELFNEEVLIQKMNYIHNNPVKAGLCENAEDYYYSSAKFYSGGEDVFKILTHYSGN